MEILIAAAATCALYFLVRTRLEKVRQNMEREELVRELLRQLERKKKIDALYGRDKEDK